MNRADIAAQAADVHSYSARLLLFVCLSEHLRELYREKGIDDGIWYDSMLDLKWKLWECKTVKGIWGSFVAHWFPKFFDMTRFAFGRLQFEVANFRGEYTKDGKTLTSESKVINVHIPRTLTPIDKESCDASYQRAKEFFADKLDGAPMAFVCSSWLLSSVNEKILHEKSNVRRFMAEYDVIHEHTNDEGEHPDAWRIFDMDFTGNVDDYPEDSFVRRAYKAHIKSGGRTGRGYGVFFA